MPLLVPCAKDSEGRAVLPSFADPSQKYTCFGCNRRVVAHKGGIRVHHFKHHAGGVSCGESTAHRIAKGFVCAAVRLPAFSIFARCQDCDSSTELFRGSSSMNGVQECRADILGRMYRVDVSVERGGVAWADIEVCHTNPCHAQKRRDLSLASRHGMLEIEAKDALKGMQSIPTIQTRRCRKCAAKRLSGLCRSRAVRRCALRWAETARARADARTNSAAVRRCARRWAESARNRVLVRRDTLVRRSLGSGAPSCGTRVIHAPAGGGKTTLILSMARQATSALLLTFSKDLSRSIKAAPNVTVMTFDSACFGKTGVGGCVTDQAIVREAWPRCKPWYKKKGGRGIADIAVARLQGAQVECCSQHSGDGIAYGVRRGMAMDSFARSRHLVEQQGIDLAAGFDHLFIDEYQDLTPQALRIVMASSTPKTFVGDPNQAIFGFQNDLCAGCGCAVRHPPAPAGMPEAIAVTRTFRSPASAVRHLRGHGIESSCTSREGGFLSVPYASLRHLCLKNVCVLVRTNSRLYEVARDIFRWHGRVGIVGGADTAQAVRKLARVTSGRPISPLHGWVRSLDDPDAAASFLFSHGNALLTDSAGSVVVSTVHRAKGSEHKHVVLADVFDRAEEFEIWYVAHTRHAATLVQLEQ